MKKNFGTQEQFEVLDRYAYWHETASIIKTATCDGIRFPEDDYEYVILETLDCPGTVFVLGSDGRICDPAKLSGIAESFRKVGSHYEYVEWPEDPKYINTDMKGRYWMSSPFGEEQRYLYAGIARRSQVQYHNKRVVLRNDAACELARVFKILEMCASC